MACLLGQPALVQLVDKVAGEKTEKEKKEILRKAETQCKSFDGKGKLTVDDYYSVLKVQVCRSGVLENVIRKFKDFKEGVIFGPMLCSICYSVFLGVPLKNSDQNLKTS